MLTVFLTADRCRPPFCVTLRQLPSLSSFFQLSLSGASLPTSSHVEDLGLWPLFGFTPKQTKRSSAWRTPSQCRSTMVSILPLISKNFGGFSKPLKTIPSVQFTIGITVNLMFHCSFIKVQWQGLSISLSYHFLLFSLRGSTEPD